MCKVSNHAKTRIRERLTISWRRVAELVDKHSVEFPLIQGGGYAYRVFWSLPDEEAFVAVCNAYSSEILTVIPAMKESRNEDGVLVQKVFKRTTSSGTVGGVVTRRLRHEAMKLAGLTPPALKSLASAMPRAFDKEFVARFVTRNGQARTKVVGRMKDADDIDTALPAVIEKAIALSAEHGTLGLTIELRNRGEINVIQEWVMEDAVAYGVED